MEEYALLKIIANAWFDSLDKLSVKQQKNLSEELVGRTIIGSLIGLPEYSEIVKYKTVCI